MRTMKDLFSGDPVLRQIKHEVARKLDRMRAKRAIGTAADSQHDDLTEAAMNILESGVFDEAIAGVVKGTAYAQPLAFDDLKEANVEDWARRRGVRVPTR